MAEPHLGTKHPPDPVPAMAEPHLGTKHPPDPVPAMAEPHLGTKHPPDPVPAMAEPHLGTKHPPDPVPAMAEPHLGTKHPPDPVPAMAEPHLGTKHPPDPVPAMAEPHLGTKHPPDPVPAMAEPHLGSITLSSPGVCSRLQTGSDLDDTSVIASPLATPPVQTLTPRPVWEDRARVESCAVDGSGRPSRPEDAPCILPASGSFSPPAGQRLHRGRSRPPGLPGVCPPRSGKDAARAISAGRHRLPIPAQRPVHPDLRAAARAPTRAPLLSTPPPCPGLMSHRGLGLPLRRVATRGTREGHGRARRGWSDPFPRAPAVSGGHSVFASRGPALPPTSPEPRLVPWGQTRWASWEVAAGTETGGGGCTGGRGAGVGRSPAGGPVLGPRICAAPGPGAGRWGQRGDIRSGPAPGRQAGLRVIQPTETMMSTQSGWVGGRPELWLLQQCGPLYDRATDGSIRLYDARQSPAGRSSIFTTEPPTAPSVFTTLGRVTGGYDPLYGTWWTRPRLLQGRRAQELGPRDVRGRPDTEGSSETSPADSVAAIPERLHSCLWFQESLPFGFDLARAAALGAVEGDLTSPLHRWEPACAEPVMGEAKRMRSCDGQGWGARLSPAHGAAGSGFSGEASVRSPATAPGTSGSPGAALRQQEMGPEGAVSSLLWTAAVAGSPGGQAAVAGSPGRQAAVAGSPGGQAAVAGSPGGQAAVAGSPGRQAAVAGSPGGQAAVAGSPGRQAAVAGSPGRQAAVAGSPGGQAAVAGSPGRQAAVAGSPGGQAAVAGSPGRQAAVAGSPGRQAAVAGSPGGQAAVAGSPGRQAAVAGSPGRQAAVPGSPGGQAAVARPPASWAAQKAPATSWLPLALVRPWKLESVPRGLGCGLGAAQAAMRAATDWAPTRASVLSRVRVRGRQPPRRLWEALALLCPLLWSPSVPLACVLPPAQL
ncbi:collagen alpha-1(I) chain-like [Lepus europaeus]|uniref:collagen alpha-1(I) chain-like n=1 Tax=Lepus europaeus TaxID=9983 RepID=UPI002B496882|nr:collagen alpha-1(I) chain-like [Lepus europaeus]